MLSIHRCFCVLTSFLKLTIYMRDYFTRLCDRTVFVLKQELYWVHPLQKNRLLLYPGQCVCVSLSAAHAFVLCVFVFDWQANPRGHAGVRRVLGVSAVTGETHTHELTGSPCDSWAKSFSCALRRFLDEFWMIVFDLTLILTVYLCTLLSFLCFSSGVRLVIWASRSASAVTAALTEAPTRTPVLHPVCARYPPTLTSTLPEPLQQLH